MAAVGRLTRLPLELIQKIAGLCTLGDLLALGYTCRHLHHICDDILVLQQSFLNNVCWPTSNAVATKVALRKIIAARLASMEQTKAKAVWASLALAASEISSLIDELDFLLGPPDSEEIPTPWDLYRLQEPHLDHVCQWVSQLEVSNIIGVLKILTVLGYPMMNDSIVTSALVGPAVLLFDMVVCAAAPIEDMRPGGVELFHQTVGVAFCLAMGALGNPVPDLDMPLLTSRVAGHFEYTALQHDHSTSFDLFQDFHGSQMIGLLSTVCTAWMLRKDARVLLRGDFPYPPAVPLLNVLRQGASIPLPDGRPSYQRFLTKEIAFEEAMSMAINSSSSRPSLDNFGFAPSWGRWLRTNIDILIEDLAQGEWVGYYTHRIGYADIDDVDPPLRNIHFTSDPDPADSDKVMLRAEDGVDSVGSFTLSGNLSRSTSTVHLVKQYFGAQTHSWHQKGTLTPLGIAGYWYSADIPDDPLGFIWMYKKEWAREGAFANAEDEV